MSPARPLPAVLPWNEHYWRGGKDGVLRMTRCTACGRLQHPTPPRCALCHTAELEIVDLSGRGTVEAFTLNSQAWHPAFTSPYTCLLYTSDAADE